MPYRDPEKRRAAVRRSKARRREGVTLKSEETPGVTPRKPLGMETPGETPLLPADVRGWAALARYMERPAEADGLRGLTGRKRIEMISASLARGKLGDHVRFGIEGPTFAEIATVLDA